MNSLRLAAVVAAVGLVALTLFGCESQTAETSPTPAASPSVEVAIGPPTPAATPPLPNAQSAAGPGPFKSLGKPTKTPDGLEIDDMKIGDGGTPKTGQYVQVHYIGTQKDGTVFDASYKRGKPIEFPLGAGQVIKGWDEGIATMKVGGRRKLTIPGPLAYADNPPPGSPFKPNETLYFDVQLVGISDAPTQ